MPWASCPIKDKIRKDGQERFVVCTRDYEVGRQVQRRVNRSRGVGICDIHGFGSVGKNIWDAVEFLKGEKRLNPDLDWSDLQRDIDMSLAWFRRWWNGWPHNPPLVGEKVKQGYLRAADDKVSQVEISARKLVIRRALEHGEALLERPAVVVQIDTKDEREIRRLQAKRRALDATRRQIQFSVEQLRLKWENVDSRALRGKEWWRTLRDAYSNANSLFSLATAYERGEAQVDEHRKRMAEIAEERTKTMSMGQEEEVGGEARERATAEAPAAAEEAAAPVAEEAVEAPADAEKEAAAPSVEEVETAGQPTGEAETEGPSIEDVIASLGKKPNIEAKRTSSEPLKRELQRAQRLMAKAVEAGATFFPADAMRQLRHAAANGGILGHIRVIGSKKKEENKAT